MKASQFLITTQKEDPIDAEIISHKLMIRAGLIKKIGAGIYTYMPMGLRIIRKIENIIRSSMNEFGAIECVMPMVQPAELWRETGRFDKFGEELLRFKDRHNNDFILQPTSEEVVTHLARSYIRSYKQLPINLYQIQTKFRDEIRPRFGIMRGREFTMKDAYSFDIDEPSMKNSYEKMFAAYHKIFQSLKLEYRAVQADTGSIGGIGSCEFHVISNNGEDTLMYCENSDFAANIEATPAPCLIEKRQQAQQKLNKVLTAEMPSCKQVATFLSLDITQTIKSIVLAVDENDETTQIYLLLLRGDHQLNEVKIKKIDFLSNFRWANATEIEQCFSTIPGYIGPINTKNVKIIADATVANMSDFICGANQENYHFTGCNWSIDLPEPDYIYDIRNAEEGDLSPDNAGKLKICKGIEVGHVFMLGTKYSQDMNANFIDANGKNQPLVMGCYGIGVTRIMGAAIEQNHDEQGIIWPHSIAPFQIVICPIAYEKSEKVRHYSDLIYKDLKNKNFDVILDDREERLGSMLADWDLIGIPHRIVIGEKSLNNNSIEYKTRKHKKAQIISLDEINNINKIIEENS